MHSIDKIKKKQVNENGCEYILLRIDAYFSECYFSCRK